METDYFNQYAAESMGWTKSSISRKTTEIMADFQLQHELGDILLVHASPREPENWHYILDMDDAGESFDYFTQKICMLGHTHRPYIVFKEKSGEAILSRETEELLTRSAVTWLISDRSASLATATPKLLPYI